MSSPVDSVVDSAVGVTRAVTTAVGLVGRAVARGLAWKRDNPRAAAEFHRAMLSERGRNRRYHRWAFFKWDAIADAQGLDRPRPRPPTGGR